MVTGKNFTGKAEKLASTTSIEEIRRRIGLAEKIESYGVASWWRRILEIKELHCKRR